MTKVRLFEAFAGVGSQLMALKNIGIEVESVGISEWDINSILTYDSIHSENPDVDLTSGFSLAAVEEKLTDLGISSDGKNPLTDSKLKKMSEDKKRQILSAMIRTKNIGSIVGKKAPECDLFTYSFPCQDISVAGKRGGFSEGSDTRSSLLWQCRNTVESVKPKVLLMENVKNLVSKKYIGDFTKWIEWLSEQGYTSTWQTLNAKDYGVPQNRERVFMVSILGEESYEFPEAIPLTKRVLDIMEDEVDESYFISEDQKSMLHRNASELASKTGLDRTEDDSIKLEFVGGISKKDRVGDGKLYSRNFPQGDRVYNAKGIAVTQTAQGGGVGGKTGLYLIENSDKVRRLTPNESWRLMGFSDEDFKKAESVMSKTQLLKQAGNSIVVPVLEAIFKNIYQKENSYDKN